MQLLKPKLPDKATIEIIDYANDRSDIEIGVPLNSGTADSYNLCHPRLFGEVKKVNDTWSVTFSIDFYLLKNTLDKFIFEVETKPIVRTQFKSKQSMVSRLTQVYSQYHHKQENCDFNFDTDVITQINDYFDNEISSLALVDSDWKTYLI